MKKIVLTLALFILNTSYVVSEELGNFVQVERQEKDKDHFYRNLALGYTALSVPALCSNAAYMLPVFYADRCSALDKFLQASFFVRQIGLMYCLYKFGEGLDDYVQDKKDEEESDLETF